MIIFEIALGSQFGHKFTYITSRCEGTLTFNLFEEALRLQLCASNRTYVNVCDHSYNYALWSHTLTFDLFEEALSLWLCASNRYYIHVCGHIR